jgi:hypothetical protein
MPLVACLTANETQRGPFTREPANFETPLHSGTERVSSVKHPPFAGLTHLSAQR